MKTPFGKVQVGEARSSSMEKRKQESIKLKLKKEVRRKKDWKKTLKTALAGKSSRMRGSMSRFLSIKGTKVVRGKGGG